MPYQTATATDHHDALDQLSDFMTAEGGCIGALSAVVVAGGSGYSIGDDIDVAFGAFRRAARFNVDSEGASSADSIAAGGSGYTNGTQVLTLVGGTFTTAATVEVEVVGNAVDSINSVTLAGDYTVTPGDPVSTTGGGGTGATLNMTFGAVATVSLLDHGFYSELAGGGQPTNPAGTVAVSPATGTGCTLTVTYSPEIVAGGTGWTVGDIVTVSGGTSTSITTLEVTAVSGGAVTALKYLEHGGYSVEPTNTVSTTGAGSGLTLDLNYETNGWTLRRNNVEAVSATIAAGGSSYSVGDKLTLVGGVEVKTAAIFNVDAETGGVIDSVSVEPTDGDYGEVPADPVATTTGGGGSGATLNVTFQRVTGTTKGRDLILEGDAAGAPVVGIRSYTHTPSGADSWELRGMTGYSAAVDWETQPDICDGDNVAGEDGQYTPLDAATLTYRFYVEDASVRAIFKMSTTYTSIYNGFMDRFGTATEYPTPHLVVGCSSTLARLFGSGVIGYRGMVDPISAAINALGPARYRDPGGTWKVVSNGEDTGSGRNANKEVIISPCGQTDPSKAATQDVGSVGNFETVDFIPNTGNPGSPTFNVIQTPGASEDESVLIPCVVIESDPVIQMVGVMRGVRWVSAKASPSDLQSEDSVLDSDGNTWDIFQNCNQTDQWTFFAVRREQ